MNGNGINGTNGRDLRNLGHGKQNRMRVQEGPPNLDEMQEGVPVLRSVSGTGIVQYIKYKGDLYASHFTKHDRLPIAKGDERLSKFHDGLVTGAMGQNWTSLLGAAGESQVYGTWDNSHTDLASIIRKINEIITVLRYAGILEEDTKWNDSGS